MENPFINLKSITPEEMAYLNQATTGLADNKLRDFVTIYASKRRESDLMLLMCCIGFVGAAGIQRFLVGQIGMGILYFFTGGLCMIGTIVDLVNHKQIATDFNRK